MGSKSGSSGGGKFGKGGGGSSSPSTNTLDQLAQVYGQYGQAQGNLGSTLAGYGLTPLAGGQSQYVAGLTGQQTPAQQALSQFQLGQADLNTQATAARLGEPPASVNSGLTTDLNANLLQNVAQQEQTNFANETMGLNAMGQGAGMLGEAGGLYGQAAQNIFNQAAPLLQQKTGGSGTSPTTGMPTGGLWNYLTDLFGGGGGAADPALGSVAGSSTMGALTGLPTDTTATAGQASTDYLLGLPSGGLDPTSGLGTGYGA